MGNYYHTCPDCGANLDPGEHCDCASPVVVTEEKTEEDTDAHTEH